ncbi:MAG: FAD-binding domain-containing protein, partial [Synechococcales bacterium]|nr:FAD-binding domain-containing protein [Synechococcales bacterium]
MRHLILFWHRRDLRIADNIGLAIARQQTQNIIGLFCLDPKILQRDDIADVRVDYLLGCLRSLAERYRQVGSQLLFFQGNPTEVIPTLAQALNAQAVYWNWDVEPYAQQRDNTMIAALNAIGIEVQTFWDQLLHSPLEIVSKAEKKPYTIYSPFWKNWIAQPKQNPYPTLEGAIGLTPAETAIAQQCGAIPLPTLGELGFIWQQGQVLEPGEAAAQKQLDRFIAKPIASYDNDRNFPALPGTSSLSPALKFGAIGIRTIWQATQTALQHATSNEATAGITTWQQELAWREFYQHVLYHFPELAEGAYRAIFKQFPWDSNEAHFQAWTEGKTGYPIVDAALRQLNQTGWMHNRCRMIVASFLTKDLILDWRWGEKYFMQRLVDGDLAANNGGWQWSASSGMDPRPLRIFNPASQAKKFDAEADYIRQWIPELRNVSSEALVSGVI